MPIRSPNLIHSSGWRPEPSSKTGLQGPGEPAEFALLLGYEPHLISQEVISIFNYNIPRTGMLSGRKNKLRDVVKTQPDYELDCRTVAHLLGSLFVLVP